MLFFETIFQNFKSKINKTQPVTFFFSVLLCILIVYGFITEYIFSINFPLNSDSTETGIVSMEIWRHHNFLLNQFYLPSADPLYFSETITFQLLPQILSNFSPFVLKIVSFIIFILALTVFGYITYIVSKRIICVLVFFALMLNLTPASYIFFNGPTNHIATIFFIGLFIVFILYDVQDKLINSIVFIILLNLIVYSDSLIIIWFIIPLVLYNMYFYKQLKKQNILFIVSAVITSSLTYFYKTYFNSNLFNGYSLLSFVTSYEQFFAHLALYFKGLLLLFSGNLYNSVVNTQKVTFLDVSFIVISGILLICLIYYWKKRDITFIHFFAVFSGVVISFIYIFFTTISINIVTTRYLIFLCILIFIVLSIECKKNHIILTLIIILLVINATSNFSAISTTQNPNKEQLDMIEFLKSNQLYSGYGDYWDSNLITYLSNEVVIIRPVRIIDDQITPFYWVSAKEWYNVSSENGYFILVKPNGVFLSTNSLTDYLKTHSQNKIIHYNNYDIYIFNEKPVFTERIIYHQVGHIIEEQGKKYVDVFPNEGKGFALYGPYDRISPGRYLVNFDIKINNSSKNSTFTDQPFGKIDVASQTGKIIIEEKRLNINDLLSPNDTSLEFTLYEPEILEFRVWSENILPFKVGAEPKLTKL
jgi:hypothetical protein